MGQYKEYSDEDIIIAIKESRSYAEALKKLGLKLAGGNYDQLKLNIKKFNLDISHFKGQGWNKGESLKDWEGYEQGTARKIFLIKERGHICEECGVSEWRNFPVVLELHHVDGNSKNNDKENLQLLCCNCHAMTENWRNRKGRLGKLIKPNQ